MIYRRYYGRIKTKINELLLQVQSLEQRVKDLEEGSFGTGVYLDGCTETDMKYIKDTKKAGE